MTKLSNIKKLVGSKIFNAKFVKKNGELRSMTCRLKVTKHLKGGEKKYDTDSLNYLTVFDMKKSAYRTININTLQSLTIGGKVYAEKEL